MAHEVDMGDQQAEADHERLPRLLDRLNDEPRLRAALERLEGAADAK